MSFSYHDVVAYVGARRFPLTSSGYGLSLQCCRTAGWQLWDMHANGGNGELIGGEFDSPHGPFCIEVGGVVILGVKPAVSDTTPVGGWTGRIQNGPKL